MARHSMLFVCAIAFLVQAGCGGGSGTTVGGGGRGGGTPSKVPALTGIAPSTALVGASDTTILAFGSNFADGATIQWNGMALATNCANTDSSIGPCANAPALVATIPAANLGAAGIAQITLQNPGALGGTSSSTAFTVVAAPPATTWVRAVSGVTVPSDLAWDSVHGKLYVSVQSVDPNHANTIAVIDPIAGTVSSYVAAGKEPNLLTISSDGAYLWAGLDGDYAVQRLLLPGLTKDISIQLKGPAESLEAAPQNPHTLALVLGTSGGVYVYDDNVQRPISIPAENSEPSAPVIEWIQWGKDDSTLWGGFLPLAVTPSGVSWNGSGSFELGQALFAQFDRQNGELYYNRGVFYYGGEFNPALDTMDGSFNLPLTGPQPCTADSTLNRYYCVISIGATDVSSQELWVFDLNTKALLNRVYFGDSNSSLIPGIPVRLVRWGNAGLAVTAGTLDGKGGVYLIDGAAVNPNSAPDVDSGSSAPSFAWLSSLSPESTTAGSGNVTVTIGGTGFSPDSTACSNCSYLQFRMLPTQFVSSTQLKVTIPIADMPTTEPMEISVFDHDSNQFSSNALTFTTFPASASTSITPLNLCGLSMAWDANSQLLYVGTADYDGGYPNSVVAVNPQSGTVTKSVHVSSDPYAMSVSSGGQYLYLGFSGATNLTQLALPSLGSAVTWPLVPGSGLFPLYPAYDVKAAPENPHTTAVTFYDPYTFDPGGMETLAIFDDSNPRPTYASAPSTASFTFDYIAWGNTDTNLSVDGGGEVIDGGGALSSIAVDSSGATYLSNNSAAIKNGEIHSDFGTGLVYGDNGNVADPTTGALVGSYNASGVVAPDSSLNRVFILGQTQAQANTNNFTIQSFDQKSFTPVSSISLSNLSGSPIQMVRWGTSGLAVLTSGGPADILENGLGMLYLVQDSTFVSNVKPASGLPKVKQELVQQRWKHLSKREMLTLARRLETRR